MLERDMENLIARFPEEFFAGHSFILRGRQQAFAGIGRFDLLFTDQFKTNVLMELKAVTAKYENATQLARYKEALEARGERNILMWLIAPHIPASVREFLDRIGIEYSEIHEAQFLRVAERHEISIESARKEWPLPRVRSASRATGGGPALPEYRLTTSFDRQESAELINEFEGAVRRRIDRSLALKLRVELVDAASPGLERQTMLQLARWCGTDGPIYSDGMEVAQKISRLLFGEVLDRGRLGT